MEFNPFIEKITSIALLLLLAITSHEIAHGYIGNLFGDSTARKMGRLTLNPIPLIDFIGTLIIPVGIFIITKSAFCFGYAKPIPVNFMRLYKPKLHIIYVVLAGPVANLIQAVIWSLILASIDFFPKVESSLLLEICKFGIFINIILFVVNLFLIPPLDGGKVLSGFLPTNAYKAFSKIEPFGLFIVLLLMLLEIFTEFWIKPLMELTFIFLDLIKYPFTNFIN